MNAELLQDALSGIDERFLCEAVEAAQKIEAAKDDVGVATLLGEGPGEFCVPHSPCRHALRLTAGIAAALLLCGGIVLASGILSRLHDTRPNPPYGDTAPVTQPSEPTQPPVTNPPVTNPQTFAVTEEERASLAALLRWLPTYVNCPTAEDAPITDDVNLREMLFWSAFFLAQNGCTLDGVTVTPDKGIECGWITVTEQALSRVNELLYGGRVDLDAAPPVTETSCITKDLGVYSAAIGRDYWGGQLISPITDGLSFAGLVADDGSRLYTVRITLERMDNMPGNCIGVLYRDYTFRPVDGETLWQLVSVEGGEAAPTALT